jgi:uncharacterized LabA/DUF88 family protein/cold shock CspA family protein
MSMNSLTAGPQKIGIYVDVANIARNGGYGMRFDILREFASREGGEPIRLNAYVAFDEEKARADRDYKERAINFYSALRDFGFKVIEKIVVWYEEGGRRYGKANADLDMAVDALLQSENLDRVVLATGDGDFLQVVRALQNKGCRVEVVAFQNVSALLKREADFFISGYLVPNLLPSEAKEGKKWGENWARGVCYHFQHEKNFGFIRFLDKIGPGLWITDTRREDSPFKTAFVHESAMHPSVDVVQLPNRDYIFEFDIKKVEKGLQAENVVKVCP